MTNLYKLKYMCSDIFANELFPSNNHITDQVNQINTVCACVCVWFVAQIRYVLPCCSVCIHPSFSQYNQTRWDSFFFFF